MTKRAALLRAIEALLPQLKKSNDTIKATATWTPNLMYITD
jgi:hypothetical protein